MKNASSLVCLGCPDDPGYLINTQQVRCTFHGSHCMFSHGELYLESSFSYRKKLALDIPSINVCT